MALKDTIFGRLRKLLRVRFGIDASQVSPDSTLGGPGIGFDTPFIQSEFRVRTNDWFEDFIEPLPNVNWNEDITLGAVTKSLIDRSTIKSMSKYKDLVTALTEAALDDAAGEGAQTVPVAIRPEVQASMNSALLEVLIRDIALSDYEGKRPSIVANITDRMLI